MQQEFAVLTYKIVELVVHSNLTVEIIPYYHKVYNPHGR